MLKRLRRGPEAALLARKRGVPNTSAPNKPRPRLQVVQEGKNANIQTPGRSIFILRSALTTKLHLELAYRDPCRPAQTNVTPQTPNPARSTFIFGDQPLEVFGDSHS